MLSGGTDSTWALWKLLTTTTHKVHVHHVHYYNRMNRGPKESKACTDIMEWCAANLRPVASYTESWITTPETHVSLLDLWWITPMVLPLLMANPTIDEWIMGGSREGVGRYIGTNDSGKLAKDIVTHGWSHACASCAPSTRYKGRDIPSYVWEAEFTKPEMWEQMGPELSSLVWSCHTPCKRVFAGNDNTEYTLPCGECVKCENLGFPKVSQENFEAGLLAPWL